LERTRWQDGDELSALASTWSKKKEISANLTPAKIKKIKKNCIHQWPIEYFGALTGFRYRNRSQKTQSLSLSLYSVRFFFFFFTLRRKYKENRRSEKIKKYQQGRIKNSKKTSEQPYE